jgi:hypothetical protein
VHRGLFWDLVELLRDGAARGEPGSEGLDVRVVKRFVATTYTNFEDQDLVVTRRQPNADGASQDSPPSTSPLLSVRFVYTSNVDHFPKRCSLIHDWFFQCLNTTVEIFRKVAAEEPTVGLLYWNSGLWDWRTGVPVKDYARNIQGLLRDASGLFQRAKVAVMF